ASGLRAEGCAAAWVSADLADRAAVLRGAAAAAGPFGEPDIVVNAAGLNIRPPLADLAMAEWDALLAVNLTAPFLLGQQFGPAMARRGRAAAGGGSSSSPPSRRRGRSGPAAGTARPRPGWPG